MAVQVGGPRKGIRVQINITPLVDVVLVLLIIFMVVTPMLQRGKDVRLPEVKRPDEASDDGDPLILSVTRDRKIYLEQSLLDEADLRAELGRRLSAQPGRKILLKGDERLTYGDVRRIMEEARLSGAKGISLGVQQRKER